MYDAAEEILQFSSGKTRSDLDNDRQLSLSIVRLLEIIGEAANKVSVDTQSNYTRIPWKEIVDMRNRLIHGYYDVDLDIVWKTVTDEIPLLAGELEIVLKETE